MCQSSNHILENKSNSSLLDYWPVKPRYQAEALKENILVSLNRTIKSRVSMIICKNAVLNRTVVDSD